MLYLMGRQVLFFSPDQHNNFDHFSAGFTSFHRKEEIRAWYEGWEDVAVRYSGVANESIYARGRGRDQGGAAAPAAFCSARRLSGRDRVDVAAPPRITDRDVYEATAAHGVVYDCSDLHCFRVLVPWILGPLPGSSILKWKAYAVVSNAAAAVAVFGLSLTLGLSRRAAWFASIGSAFGFGSLYTLHDVYTSDPLMYLAGPLISNELLLGRTAVAAVLGAVGVFAKEFAAAPLYLMTAYAVVERRWSDAVARLAAANFAFMVWLALTLMLMLRFNYTYSGSASADLGGGANLVGWLSRQSPRGIASAMFVEFGAL